MRRWDAVVVACLSLVVPGLVNGMSECYNPKTGDPQVCLPPFVNAAFGKEVDATNTCGLNGPEEYCVQTGATGVTKSCHFCDGRDRTRQHNASLLTDVTDEDETTWWQSQTMLFDVQHPSMVNLTLNLGKAFDITYVRLKFHSSRPESFSIYKKTCETCEWVPYQFYSGTCHPTYALDNKDFITIEDEQKALCTEDYSDISPLSGANVAFSTLEGRPSAFNFDHSAVLQDWVTAVSIRISLNRINTFGDEVFSDSKVLKSYYYAISDVAVGARCKCNGHSSECVLSATGKMVCVCEHNTAGDDCQLCAPLYNDAPWQRGGDGNAHACRACDCNGLADACVFDADLYRTTGHGGRCVACRDNTAGVHCELCLSNHYREPTTDRCVSCDCSPVGSLSEQCHTDGTCSCKSGVTGRQCDQCLPGYFGLNEAGCSLCQCSASGTVAGTVCDAVSGQCVCKLNAEGVNCDQCKPGTMNLQHDNPYGCTACFCHGHSSLCEVAGGYTIKKIVSGFVADAEGWKAADSGGTVRGEVSWSRDQKIGLDGLYFSAPAKFLGTQRFSYNQFLLFNLSVDQSAAADESSGGGRSSVRYGHDLIIEGDQYRVSLPLYGQNNPEPSSVVQKYRFRLHEAAGFVPRLTAFQFQRMLNDLNSIRIRALNEDGFTFLHSVVLDSAEEGGTGPAASWIERCIAEGYTGGQANSCAPGYTRATASGGVYSKCVKCDCNGHGDECDPETGVCKCRDNFAGDHCEICAVGYYMDDKACVPCPCPNQIACARTDDGSVKCLSCPPGHYGNHCKFCMDGWYGVDTCQRCLCNGNIDPNAVMNCDSTTGECLKCIYNTTGFRCQQCLDGFYGNPLSKVHEERCQACACFSLGSVDSLHCDEVSGQCKCLPNVAGQRCDQCKEGYWNLHSGEGCTACGCDSVGATTGKCDQGSGQCDCLPGVTGQRCDRCEDNHYDLTREGCKACECNELGSANLQCDDNGKCVCKTGVFGLKCDQCEENFHDLSQGCIECPACYGLVQDAVNTHRNELARLEYLVATIGVQRPSDGDAFTKKLNDLKDTLGDVKQQANALTDKRNTLNEKVDEVNGKISELLVKVSAAETNVDSCASRVEEANSTTAATKELMMKIDNSLNRAKSKLNEAAGFIDQAKLIAVDSLNKENNMTRLADEAEAIADQHEQESLSVVSSAQHALDTSTKALDAMHSSITTLNELIDSFDEMNDTRLPAAIALRDDLAKFSEEMLEKTNEAKMNATELLTEAEKLVLPDYDVNELNTEIELVVHKANSFAPERESLNTEFEDGHLLIQADIDRAEELLTNSDTIQDTTDMLTAQAHGARGTAKKAVAKGDAAYKSLLDTEETLRTFSTLIEQNKADALDALDKIPSIQATIDEANRKTNKSRASLGKAREYSEQARGKALNAQNIAQQVQSQAQNIRYAADGSLNEVNDIQNNVNAFKSRVDETQQQIEQEEASTNVSTNAVKEALKDAASAKAKANAANAKVKDVLAKLDQLMSDLGNLDDLSPEQMTQLESEFTTMQQNVQLSGVDEAIAALQEEVKTQDEAIANYDEEIRRLKIDVENVRQIDQALPSDCVIAEDGVEVTNP